MIEYKENFLHIIKKHLLLLPFLVENQNNWCLNFSLKSNSLCTGLLYLHSPPSSDDNASHLNDIPLNPRESKLRVPHIISGLKNKSNVLFHPLYSFIRTWKKHPWKFVNCFLSYTPRYWRVDDTLLPSYFKAFRHENNQPPTKTVPFSPSTVPIHRPEIFY